MTPLMAFPAGAGDGRGGSVALGDGCGHRRHRGKADAGAARCWRICGRPGGSAGPGIAGSRHGLDSLFNRPSTTPQTQDLRGETGRIPLTALGETGVSDADSYLTQLVAANTGVDQATAAKRVDDAIAQVTPRRSQRMRPGALRPPPPLLSPLPSC